jgi:hypothetical protein
MVWVRLFLSAFLFFTLLGCEKEDDVSNEFGGVNSSCYSAKSEIYKADTASAEHRTAAQSTVKFFDRGGEVADFQVLVDEGKYIVLPDIRAKYCKYENHGKVLTGWDDGVTLIRPGQKYKVTDADVAFAAVWEEGIEIYTAKELYDMRDNLGGKYKLMRNIDLAEYSDWEPIGGELIPDPFTGELYGNGYTIDNLTIDNDSGSTAGLFGAIGGKSAVYDLRIALSAGGIKLYGVDRKKAAGTLAGYVILDSLNDNVTVENVKTLSGSGLQNGIQIGNSICSGSAEMYAGGIVGAIEVKDSFTELNIIHNSNSVNVSPYSSAPSCKIYLGGIVGGSFYTTPDSSKITISGSKNYGYISSNMFSHVYIGGIAGSVLIYDIDNVEVVDCENYGEIKVASSAQIYEIIEVFAGGIAGKTDAKVNRCANHANVEIKNNHAITSLAIRDRYFAAGGIIGDLSDIGMIIESRNFADISAFSDNTSVDPRIFAGGLCGSSHGSNSSPPNHAVVKNSVNIGYVSAYIIDNNTSGIHADAGGLVGYAYNYADIADSYNTGNISAITNNLFAGATKFTSAGGIAGRLGNNSTIERTYNNGSVSVDATGGLTTPISRVMAGGIVGYLHSNSAVANSSVQLNSDVAVSPIPPAAYRAWIIGRAESSTVTFVNYSQYNPLSEHGPNGNDGQYAPVLYQTIYESLGFDLTDNWKFNTDTIPPTLKWEKE